ncbi:MAG: DUF4430 domain-containing protein [Clostridia bacterium]|nr:DUF4430 domain-containing protein [Clostridia bacterium]
MAKHKNKIIAGLIIAAALAFAFLWGGNSPAIKNENLPEKESANITETQAEPSSELPEKEEEKNDDLQAFVNEPSHTQDSIEESEAAVKDAPQKDEYQTEPIPEGKPVPIEPENTVISHKELTCTMSVRCDAILKNIALLDKAKVELVPKDGIIYGEQSVTFYEGESVFNVLVREMKRNKIHMKFENTPVYNSAYIEGIGNLYEFDCGELSGWMYKVNGWFPNYGCSRYQLKEGDKVEWVYTCDLGADVGKER